MKNERKCPPIEFTAFEVRLLLLAAAARLDRLVTCLANGLITGKVVDKRIGAWKTIIAKLNQCLENEEG